MSALDAIRRELREAEDSALHDYADELDSEIEMMRRHANSLREEAEDEEDQADTLERDKGNRLEWLEDRRDGRVKDARAALEKVERERLTELQLEGSHGSN